ncbi:hypothetical protein OOT55_12075 [Marinimicrobium sp. C6131]|uniref:hypothetical protein n=1 Tax=Marinimicrobium sp. C6131 TaxID=3022676 RepID=UPI00223CE7D8|nr:hypothetical protein [Marinimicrobium sp. C6131]UZJ43389.1 hypothetical protein OOT55_12075 [Marinimicrobium sp. C6131]
MKSHSELIRLVFFGVLLVAPLTLTAEPYLALRTGQPCAACHVNPSGGGLRSSYGAYYGAYELPAQAGATEAFDGGQVNDSLRFGTDLRFSATQMDVDGDEAGDARRFNTQTGQLYLAFQPKGSPVMLYLDQQLLPGGGRNREAFVMMRFGDHSVKAGNLMLPFGLRLEDDSAFVRQASGFNFNNSDQGVELGLNFDRLRFDVALSNGSNSQSNDDRNFQYLTRGEYVTRHWRAGGSYVLNDAEIGQRELASLFGGFTVGGYGVLLEFSRIEDDSVTNLPGIAQVQEVSLVELNRELAKGYNLKLTTEWLDPDTAIDENERNRHSLLLEYTPYASLQLRGGIRVGEDIPQRETGNFTQGFVQVHFYY